VVRQKPPSAAPREEAWTCGGPSTQETKSISSPEDLRPWVVPLFHEGELFSFCSDWIAFVDGVVVCEGGSTPSVQAGGSLAGKDSTIASSTHGRLPKAPCCRSPLLPSMEPHKPNLSQAKAPASDHFRSTLIHYRLVIVSSSLHLAKQAARPGGESRGQTTLTTHSTLSLTPLWSPFAGGWQGSTFLSYATPAATEGHPFKQMNCV
jgi:hypothetical protein